MDRIEHPTFRADFTYATGIVKAPVLEPSIAASIGRLRYLDLGFFRGGDAGTAKRPSCSTPRVLAPLRGLRPTQSDKRTFGHLFVIGGSRSYPGAVLMAVRAALRSGAGLVTAFVPESLVAAFAATAPEAIWVGWPEAPDGSLALDGLPLLRARLERATALVMGPGLGPEREAQMLAVEVVKLAGIPLVLDADALQPPVLAPPRASRRSACRMWANSSGSPAVAKRTPRYCARWRRRPARRSSSRGRSRASPRAAGFTTASSAGRCSPAAAAAICSPA